MKKTLILTFLFFLIILTACSKQDVVILDNGIEKIKINIEIVDTFEKRAEGLMFRQFLDENSGMLFIFENENFHQFWMKNTLIPLDMIFISESFEIVDIIHAEPCKKDPCVSYRAIKPAKYVLEVNGNFTVRNSINLGNRIILNKKY